MAWYNENRVKQPGSVVLREWNYRREMERSLSRARNEQARRTFQGGIPDRLTGNFNAFNSSLDTDLFMALPTLRARSRHLCQNNPHGKKFLRMVSSNVVGQGFKFHARSMQGNSPDVLDNQAIQQALKSWSKLGSCDITGKLSFSALCRLAISTIAQDGEVLIRKVRGKSVNAFGFTLQMLDVDRLPVNYNARLSNGNLVRMGVEMEPTGKPVAYWLYREHPFDYYGNFTGQMLERVPADDIYHVFVPFRPEQTRGIPWAHTAIRRLYHIDELDQSALIAARKGADTLGFFTSPDGEPPDPNASGTDDAPIEVSVPGTFDTLPEGYDFKPYDAKYPNDVYPVFLKAALRSVASGLGVAYNSLANDLEGVNYSSIRSGVLEERDLWMEIQDWMIESLMSPIYEDWLLMALGMNAITGQTGKALPATKYFKFKSHEWQGRRWGWVDPEKDVNAATIAINNGLKSRTRVSNEMGLDRETTWKELQQETQEAETMGITLAEPQYTNKVTSAPENVPPNKGN